MDFHRDFLSVICLKQAANQRLRFMVDHHCLYWKNYIFWILLECVSPILGHTRVHPLTAKGLGGTVTTVGASKVAGLLSPTADLQPNQ